MTWTPILEGELKARAEVAIDEIAAAIPTAIAPLEYAGLTRGTAGFATLYLTLERARPGQGHGDRAVELYERAVDHASAEMGFSLFSGLAGTAWAIEHAQRSELAPFAGDPNDEIDQSLLEVLARSPWQGEYDLVGGLVGLGVYALERFPRGAAVPCLELVVDRLAELVEPTKDGFTWHTGPALLPAWQRELCPQGHYNLGLAHGVPGTLPILAAAVARGVRRGRASELLAGAVSWLLAQRLADGDACFASWVAPGVERKPARTAWCYGDPGVAIALLAAAREAAVPAWEAEATAIAAAAARRSREACGVVDAGLCHGAAGLTMIFARFYQATNDERFRSSARDWLAWILEHRQADGVGGIVAARAKDGQVVRRQPEAGLLFGAAGVAAALSLGVSEVEPAWDAHMLASTPPRR